MDVIALDRAGIAEAVAPNGTAVTEAQLERMWRLDPAPILCFDGDAPGRRPRSAPRCAPSPTSGPSEPCASSSCPPARTPTTSSIRAGSEAFEACSPTAEPLVERLWRHEVEAAPARHARGPRRPQAAPDRPRPGDRRSRPPPALPRRVAARFDALVRPQQAARSLYPRREWKKGRDGRFAPPSPARGDSPRASARPGSTARPPAP